MQWPLTVWLDQLERNIAMNATHNIVLYESTTTQHGRPYTFIGDAYAGLYLHFRPPQWQTMYAT